MRRFPCGGIPKETQAVAALAWCVCVSYKLIRATSRLGFVWPISRPYRLSGMGCSADSKLYFAITCKFQCQISSFSLILISLQAADHIFPASVRAADNLSKKIAIRESPVNKDSLPASARSARGSGATAHRDACRWWRAHCLAWVALFRTLLSCRYY